MESKNIPGGPELFADAVEHPLALNGLRRMAKIAPEKIPDISEAEIREKSKANGLARFLVCLQACWFFAQILGRLATATLNSRLELNTSCTRDTLLQFVCAGGIILLTLVTFSGSISPAVLLGT